LTLVLSAFLASTALAQEPIEPLPAPDEAIEPEQPAKSEVDAPAKPGAEATGTAEPRWRTGFRLSESYDSNVNLATDEDAVSDWPALVIASLKGHFGRQPWRLGIQAEGGANIYPEVSEFNAPVFGGSLDLERTGSGPSRVYVHGNYRRDYVRSIVRLVDAGLLPGKVLSSAYTGGAGFQRGLAPRLSFIADATYDRVSYDEDRIPAGDTGAAGGGFAWDVSATDRVDLTYQYHRTRSGDLDGQGHVAGLSWSRRLSRTLDAGIAAGIAREKPLGSEETLNPWSLTGRLSGKHGRHRVAASYRHSLEQAYGFGRSLEFDAVSLDEDYSLTPRMVGGLRGSYSRGDDPLDSSYTLTGWSALGELVYRVSPRTTARLGYSFVRTGDSERPDISSHLVEFSLSWERPWQ
jgi:hypothetical protein